MKVSKGPYCSAVHCSNNRGLKPDLHFFTFPKDPERCKNWVINCRREDLLRKSSEYLHKNCRLCTEHFERSQFMNSNKNSLIKTAVPTLFAILNPPKPIMGKRKRTNLVLNRPTLSNRQTVEVDDSLTLSLKKEPTGKPNEDKMNGLKDDTMRESELVLLPKIEIKSEPEEEELREEADLETAGQTIDENDPLAVFPKREPKEEPSEMEMDIREDESMQISKEVFLLKGEPKLELEEEINEEEEDLEESVKETSNLQSVNKEMNISCYESNPSCSHNQGEFSSFKYIMRKNNEDKLELVVGHEVLHKHERDLKKMNNWCVDIDSCSTLEMVETERNDESERKEKGTNSDSECRGIIKKERQEQEGEGCDSVERQRCSSPNTSWKSNGPPKNKDSLRCESCCKFFRYKSDFERHNRIHTGEKPFKCSDCGYSFAQKANLDDHMRVHTDKRLFQCSECKKSFKRKGNLFAHMLIHTGERPFRCSVCGKTFNHRSALNGHKLGHISDKFSNCSVLKRTFPLKPRD